MSRRIGILRTERGSERIHISECHRKGFHVQLTAHREVRHLSEEILTVIHLAVLCTRNVIEIHRGHLEHLACALAVTSCNERCVYIDKISLLEKLMNGISDQRTHPENRLEGIRSRSQMSDRAQILETVALLLQRIIRGRLSLDADFLRLDLKRLLCLRRLHERTRDDQRASDIQLADLFKILQRVRIHDLKRLKK